MLELDYSSGRLNMSRDEAADYVTRARALLAAARVVCG